MVLTPTRESDRLALEIERVAASLERGYTLPADWYVDPRMYELERLAVFGSTWQLVALTSELSEPGSYTVGEIDEYRSFIVTRDEAGEIHAFHNVCPHRASTLCDGPGSGKTILCGYHGWTWRLNGSLHRAPLMDDGADFDPAEFGLKELPVGVWEPFIFVNPDPDAEPLMSYLGDLPAQVASLGVDMAAIARNSYRLVLDKVIDCNWKVAVENGMECYHCGVAHPGFAATVDLSQWQIRMGGNCVTQGTRLRKTVTPATPQKQATRLPEIVRDAALSDEGTDLALFHFIFPNQTVQVWPGPANSFSIGRFIPLGPERVRRWYARYWTKDVPEEVSQESWGFTMQVAAEDRKICRGVQVGMHSGAFTQGRFQLESSSTGEHGTQQMNRLLLQRLQRAAEAGPTL